MFDPLDLILAPDPDAFHQAARPLVADPAPLFTALPEIVRETALRHYRRHYPGHVPHALLTLFGGLESADLLTGPERAWPILQALSYVSREKHAEPFPILEVPAGGDERVLAAALEEGDFPTAFGAVRQLAADGRIEDLRDTMLDFAALDDFNLSHRLIYAAKAFERLEWTEGLDTEALLFPVTHYLCLAPRESRRVKIVDERASSGEDPLGVLGSVFDRGISRLAATRDLDWIPVSHIVNVAEALRYWRRCRGPAAKRAPGLAEVFLADVLAEVGPGETPDVPAPADGEDGELSARLQEAVRARDETGAVAAALGISDWEVLARALLLACARIDGNVTFGHDVKVVTAAIRLGGVLPEVAGFLARLPAGDRMSRAILPPIPTPD